MVLAAHRTFSNLKTKITPVATLPDGTPDADATLTVVSSAPDQVAVEADPAGGFWVETPLDTGAATITIRASSPNATYEDVTWDYSYTPFPAGQISVVIGADVSDA